MSIQSTIDLTRDEAECRAVQKYIVTEERKIKAQFVAMEDNELENYLDEHFYNYKIINN